MSAPIKPGDRVHIWQPLPLTSRRHFYGTVSAITGREGGFFTYHLIDALSVHPDEGTKPASQSGRWKHRDSLNWEMEVIDGGAQ